MIENKTRTNLIFLPVAILFCITRHNRLPEVTMCVFLRYAVTQNSKRFN